MRSRWTFLAAQTAIATACSAVAAQSPTAFRTEHTVEVRDAAARLFHVTTEFSGVTGDHLDVSLPVWTPGWYTLQYYARNVRGLIARDGDGRRLDVRATAVQTWRIAAPETGLIVVEFDYRADVSAVNEAVITEGYAFFTGVQLFLEPLGHRAAGATVRFVLPPGWRVASALSPTDDPAVFTAPDYDTLVDAPSWLGSFQLHRFDVLGKPYELVLDEAYEPPAGSLERYLGRLEAIVRVASSIFGDLPYDRYVEFWLPGEAQGADGALEHGNSVVVCCGGVPTRATRYTAHEFFHLWNVKRIRPAELWPYDYSRAVDTPSLWVSEGWSEYYGALIAYRAGFWSDSGFVASFATRADQLERNPERRNVSPADASLATWRAYLREPVSYYRAGEVLGALLDLSIRNDTGGVRGLDDVMRALYRDFHNRGRGFTPDDLVATVDSVSGSDYGEFFQRHVTGTEPLPYDSVFGLAGLRVGVADATWAELPMVLAAGDGGLEIVRMGEVAGAAGLRIDDLVVSIDEVPVERVEFFPYGDCCLPWVDGRESVRITVLRGDERVDLAVGLRRSTGRIGVVEFDPLASPRQLAVRRAWLARD